MTNLRIIFGFLVIINGVSLTQSIKLAWGEKRITNVFSAKNYFPQESAYSASIVRKPATPKPEAPGPEITQDPTPTQPPPTAPPTTEPTTAQFAGAGVVVNNPGIVRGFSKATNRGGRQNQGGNNLRGQNNRKGGRQNQAPFPDGEQFSNKGPNWNRRLKRKQLKKFGPNFQGGQNQFNNQNPRGKRFNNQPDQFNDLGPNRFDNRPRNDRFMDNQAGPRNRFKNPNRGNAFNKQQARLGNRFNNKKQPQFDNQPPFDNQQFQGPPIRSNKRQNKNRPDPYKNNMDPLFNGPGQFTQQPFFDSQNPTTIPPRASRLVAESVTPPIQEPPYQPLGRQAMKPGPGPNIKLQGPPQRSQFIQPMNKRKPGPRQTNEPYSFKKQQRKMINQQPIPSQDPYNNMQGPAYNQGPMNYPTPTPPVNIVAQTTPGYSQFAGGNQNRGRPMNEPQPNFQPGPEPFHAIPTPGPPRRIHAIEGPRPGPAHGPQMGRGGHGPHMGGPGPQMGGAGSQMGGAGPQMGGSGPQMGGTGPQMGGTGPQMGGPNIGGPKPQINLNQGPPCRHSADCRAGCCYNQQGSVLDTDTYGPGRPMEGKEQGVCLKQKAALGQKCDDLCTCQQGLDCYRRYPPNYQLGKRMAQDPNFQPPDNGVRPARQCVRKSVMLAEQWAFWKCYFDTACSGPLPN